MLPAADGVDCRPVTDMDQPAPANPIKRLSAATVLLTVVFALVSIGPPLLGLRVFAAGDILMTRAPWNATVPPDFVERLRDGDFAMWAPENSGGADLGSVPDVALLSPLSLPYCVLPTSLA